MKHLYTCSNCNEHLRGPVILPCGHIICIEHVSADQKIWCDLCRKDYPPLDYLVSEPVMSMVSCLHAADTDSTSGYHVLFVFLCAYLFLRVVYFLYFSYFM
jgi:hypothetical protein